MDIKEAFEAAPKFILGPILVALGMGYFTLADPPKTICDTQFELFKVKTEKYLYGYKKNKLKIPPGIKADIEACRLGNSPGACYDWIGGLKLALRDVRFIPTECGARLGELAPLKKWLEQSLWLFSQISWNGSSVVRKGLLSWVDNEDISIYCRTRKEYIRLRGASVWKTYEASLVQGLVATKKINEEPVKAKEARLRSILSSNCLL